MAASRSAAGWWRPGRGVLADQVVEPVAAPGGLDQEVMVIQALQVPAGLGYRDAGQRRGGVSVEVVPGCRPRQRNIACSGAVRSW